MRMTWHKRAAIPLTAPSPGARLQRGALFFALSALVFGTAWLAAVDARLVELASHVGHGFADRNARLAGCCRSAVNSICCAGNYLNSLESWGYARTDSAVGRNDCNHNRAADSDDSRLVFASPVTQLRPLFGLVNETEVAGP